MQAMSRLERWVARKHRAKRSGEVVARLPLCLHLNSLGMDPDLQAFVIDCSDSQDGPHPHIEFRSLEYAK